MTKRLIDLDDDLLAAARRQLGTTGVSDTVRAALAQVTETVARAAEVAWLTEGGLADLATSEQRAEVWR